MGMFLVSSTICGSTISDSIEANSMREAVEKQLNSCDWTRGHVKIGNSEKGASGMACVTELRKNASGSLVPTARMMLTLYFRP